MKNRIIPFDIDLHSASIEELKNFLNKKAKNVKSIAMLGVFIDDVVVKRTIGTKGSINYLVVERNESVESCPGLVYQKMDGPSDIFDVDYTIMEGFPEKPIEEKYALLSSVVTHSCDPLSTCATCNGSGRCSNCDARGYNRCSSCKGNGKTKVLSHFAKKWKPCI